MDTTEKGGADLLQRRLLAGLLAALLLWGAASALAEETKFVEPTLAPDATPYDAEHPENLEDDMLYAPSVILIEASSGDVIYQKNADQVMYPASTTKILTVLLGIELGDMDATVTVSETAMQLGDEDATTMGLEVGEEINFHDLLVGTLIRSANEGANVIAEAISGSIAEFVELMNTTAASYGCRITIPRRGTWPSLPGRLCRTKPFGKLPPPFPIRCPRPISSGPGP